MRHPIAAARQAKGLNQAELARAVGVEPWQINGWEAGQGYPPAPIAVRMARRLQLSLAEIYTTLIAQEERAGTIPPARRMTREQAVRQQRQGADHVLAQIPGPPHGAPMEVIW